MIKHCDKNPELRWLGAVIVALACTGLRISELAGLRWNDVNLETEMLTLTDETGRSDTHAAEPRRLKSGRSRSFPIHADLLERLAHRPKVGISVFYGPRQGRLKPDTVRRSLVRDVIKPLSDKFPARDGEQGFADGRLHSFRHYFCSTCANTGVPVQMLMTWLGHIDSEMVRHYYHVHDGEARRRMNEVNFLGEVADGPRRARKHTTERNSRA
jgi:integrase